MFPHQRQGGHSDDVQHITQNGHGPVAAGAVGDASEDVAHGITDEFPQTRDEPDGSGGSSQQGQIGAPDAGGALVGHIRKEADDAEQDQEHHGLGEPGFFLFHLTAPP